jgi:hypothetical protein
MLTRRLEFPPGYWSYVQYYNPKTHIHSYLHPHFGVSHSVVEDLMTTSALRSDSNSAKENQA